MSTNAPSRDEVSARDSDDAAQPDESGDDHGDETVVSTHDGGEASDGGGGDGRETPDGVDD